MRAPWFLPAVVLASLLLAARAASDARVHFGETSRNDAAPSFGDQRNLQTSSEETSDSDSATSQTEISGVLELLTTEAVNGCDTGCISGLAAAFDVSESTVSCFCPSRRRLFGETSEHLPKLRGVASRRTASRTLDELDEPASAAIALRVAGGLERGVEALTYLSESGGWEAMASELGVEESEVEFSTLIVTPPASNDTLSPIADYSDASDVAIVSLLDDGADYAGGARGTALFLSLLVLLVGTACCGLCCTFFARKRAWISSKLAGEPRAFSQGGKGSNSPEGIPHPISEVSQSPTQPIFSVSDQPQTVPADSERALPAPYAEGDAAGGSAGVAPSAFSAPVNAPRGSSMASPARVKRPNGRAGADGNIGMVMTRHEEEQAHGLLGSEEAPTRGNVIYQSDVAPLSRSAAIRDFPTKSELSETSKAGTPNSVTPNRSRLGEFLGNATPARLRRLAGRVARSPALSGGSRQSKMSSKSRSSGSGRGVGSHRRQGTFPGAYSQRNSSEMDHQRPPADPVYTFMIKTIAAKGFKFMSTTEIAFCAMRMYSHFKRTEGNYKRLAVMKNAENVPSVYEIIWRNDANFEQTGHGQSRFFSTGKGTDAEQEKSLLACLLALSWNGTNSSRSTLRRALSPTKPTRVPSPEEIFWDDFKDSTDALSGDDQMVVLARVVLLMAESSNRPSSDAASESSMRSGPMGPGSLPDNASNADEQGVDYGDIMKALSASHLREIGISLKSSRPGWQEAHVQLVSVLLVIAFLEEGAKNSPGAERPDPLSSLEWVGILTPEALDGFLVEKLEARRALVELDLEPSGLVIKHDDDGEVERVEPALSEKMARANSGAGGSWIGSRGHQKILPRSSDRKASRAKRVHRRERSTESLESNKKKSHSPVVITTVQRHKSGDVKDLAVAAAAGGGGAEAGARAGIGCGGATSSAGDRESGDFSRGGAAGSFYSQSQLATPSSCLSALSAAAEMGAAGTGAAGTGAASGGLRTIAQQRGTPAANRAAPSPAYSGERGAGGGVTVPKLTISAGDDVVAGGDARTGSMGQGNGVAVSPSAESPGYQKSEASSVVTRVYAPSSCAEADDAAAIGLPRNDASWAMEGSSPGQRSPMLSMASPNAGVGMSQASVAGSRLGSPPGRLAEVQYRRTGPSVVARRIVGPSAAPTTVTVAASQPSWDQGDSGRSIGAVETDAESSYAGDAFGGKESSQDLRGVDMRPQKSPSAFSAAAESETAFSEAASRFEGSGLDPAAAAAAAATTTAFGDDRAAGEGRLVIEPATPNSAAGSRFEGSPSSQGTSMSRIVGGGSPTAGGGGAGAGDHGPLTGRSIASSMRSGESSFFQGSSSKGRGDSRGMASSAASAASWDEEDLQNMGGRWLSERAYHQQFDEHNQKLV